MRSNYKKIGDYIKRINIKNTDGEISLLLGVNLDKKFIPSVANTVDTDMTKYSLIRKGQFGCKLMSVGRDKKLPISFLVDNEVALISSAYYVFEVKDENELLSEYLMMWFSRPESDRNLWFMSGGDIRGRITWEEFCSLPIKVPSIQKQKEIVAEYNAVVNRIKLNEELNKKLEETAQTLYKHWFVDFEFPDENGNPYKSSGGEMVYNSELDKEIPKGWGVKSLGEIIDYKKGYAFKSDDYTSVGREIIRVSDLGEKYIVTSQFYRVKPIDFLKPYTVLTNDLIITTVGSWASNPLSIVGKVIRVPSIANEFYLNQNMVRIRFNNDNLEFVYQQLIKKHFSDYLISGAQGSANQASITLDDIFQFKVTLPKTSINTLIFKNIFNQIDLLIVEKLKLISLQSILLSRMTKV